MNPKTVKMHQWRGIFEGLPAFIIGNAPSAQDEDLSCLKDHVTIGINRAFYLLDPVILFWQDRSLWDDEQEHLRKLQAIQVVRDIHAPDLPTVFPFKLRTSEPHRIPGWPHTLFGHGSSGPLAVEVALSLGCSPIVLIGMDCCHRNGKTDFYGINTRHGPETMESCREGLKWVLTVNYSCGIVNCSANDVFPERRKLADVVAQLPPPVGTEKLRHLLMHAGE